MSDEEGPEGWTSTTLGALASEPGAIVQGWSPQCETQPAEADRWGVLKTTAVQDGYFMDVHNKQLPSDLQPDPRLEVAAGDVLITCAGPRVRCGVVSLVRATRPRLMISGKIYRLRLDRTRIIPGFLEAHLRTQSTQEHIENIKTGSSDNGMNLTQARFRSVPLSIPSLDEQRRIVAKLDALRARSRRAKEALDAVPALLDRLRQSILAAAFRGDLTADWREANPDVEPASELLKRIRIERRKRWEEAELAKMVAKGKPPKDDRWKSKYVEPEPVDESELPELPEGWCWVRWNEVAFAQNGRAFPSEAYRPTGIRLLRPGNLFHDGSVRWPPERTQCLDEQFAHEHPAYVVGPGELVINLTAQSLKDDFLGRVCLTSSDERCLLNQRIARLTPVLLSPSYLLWLLKSPLFRRFVSDLNTGSLIQHMFTSQIDNFHLPLAPSAEQQAMELRLLKALDATSWLAEINQQGAATISTLDSATLAAAFRGELLDRQSDVGGTD